MSGLLARLLMVAAVGAALFVVPTTILAIVQHHQPVPFHDQWASIDEVRMRAEGRFGLSELFRQHNEHRIAVPRLLFMLDDWLCAHRGYVLLVLNCLVQILHVAVFVLLLRGAGLRGRMALVTIASVLLAWHLSGAQIENLNAPFQVQFLLVFLAPSAAFAALARAPGSGRPWLWIAAAVVAGCIATYSMANGMVVWPLLLCMGFQLRLSRAAMLAISVVAAEAIAWYLHGYVQPAQHADPLAALRQPHLVASYVACYLSSALRLPDGRPQFLLGSIVLLFAMVPFAVVCRGLLRREASQPFGHRLAMVNIGLFMIATATMTALGRINFPLISAAAGRYGTTSLLFFSSVLMAAVTTTARWVRLLGCTIAGVVLASVLCQQFVTLEQDGAFRTGLRHHGNAWEVSVSDPELTESYFDQHFQRMVWNDVISVLAEHHLALFHDRRSELLGRSLAELAPGGVGRCEGHIEHLAIVTDSGWSFAANGQASVDRMSLAGADVLFVDDRGVVLGLGTFDVDWRSIGGLRPAAGQRLVFRGYGSSAAPQTTVRAAVRGADGRIFAIDATAPFEAELAPGPGEPIADLAVARNVGFAPPSPGSRPGVPAGFTGVMVSSGNDTGELGFGPIVGVERLAVPVVTGPTGFGITIELLDQKTRAVVRRLRPAATRGVWHLWRVDVPAELRHVPLELVVKDEGTNSSQFVAVAPPQRLG